ncbi:MAG: hypothetical protein AB8B86_15305 [Pseudomonadales bacterium]
MLDITTVVVAAIVCGLCVEYFKYQTKMKKLDVEAEGGQAAANSDDIRKLKERIENLEKIVTDSGYQLGREIESL